MRAIVPGSYDPITNGHLDVIERAARLFDEVLVAIGQSPHKSPWFTPAERRELAAGACAGLAGVRVDTFEGLLVQYAEQQGAVVIVKGLRAVSDFEFECQMAQANRLQKPTIETLFVVTSAEHAYVSSSLVRELAAHGGDIAALVPPNVVDPLLRRAGERKSEARHRHP